MAENGGSTTHQPLIIVLDLDGTIIGDITYEVCEWELLKQLDPTRIRQFRSTLLSHLQTGMIRPHFADFITKLKSINDDVHFYIYTASDDAWAQYIINAVETTTGIKFNRPIFSRKHCSVANGTKSIYKTLASISPFIHRKLKNKYKFIKTPKALLKYIIMVDNNNVIADEPNKCILCPTYSWCMQYDVLRRIDDAVIAKNYKYIAKYLYNYGIMTCKSPENLAQFYAEYYNNISKGIKTTVKTSHTSHDDDLWIRLASLLQAAMKKMSNKDINTSSITKYITQRL